MSRIYVSLETDPYYNVAAEYQLFSEAGPKTCLFLWRNRPAVVLGRNQNVFAECDTEFLKEHEIVPVRRLSGGGAVFHDLGNVNFTFISEEKYADVGRYLKIISNAILSMGVECTFSGRNDLLISGKKFSGHAQYADYGNFLYHGTLMVNVNLDMLTGALKPSFLKLNSKGINSVRSRVVNLSDLCEGVTPESTIDAVIQAFMLEYGMEMSIRQISSNNMKPSILEKIKRDDWIYGEAPDFNISFEEKLSFGNVTIFANVSDGRISRLKVYTDSLVPIDFTAFEKGLTKSFFDKKILTHRLEKFVDNVKQKRKCR
ncbi:lipoate--protein ligase [Clostridium sp. MT-14]|uniref:lipoate--protein ligase n=1 Tax=Clostridium aromativorans TaxID=2836848 RepID=A0ABS8NC28_9CLOT|nr:lipoate--protein ligase [Clostridium aromativorans]MCC9296744.1 lipoate--protein ligase [Clostridium aromativorans]